MVFTKFAPFVAVAALAMGQAAAMPRVDATVHRTLKAQSTVDIVLTMKSGVDNALSAVKESEFGDRGQKIAAVVTTLEANAQASQASLNALLAQEAGSATPLFTSQQTYWITNQKVIKGATIELVEKLAALPEIAEIREEVRVPAPEILASSNTTTSGVSLLANEWGVTKVSAPSVWATGNKGQNVVIGSLDTGVRPTHSILAANFRSTYNWFDAVNRRTTPYDDLGHGSHTIGTMVGLNGVGVAPSAKFIACKAFTADGGEESWLLSCAQFLTCPTTPTGTGKDCSKAPNVINNSWGGGRGSSTYLSYIQPHVEAGNVVVFSQGNSGSACSTANSPGDLYIVIGVGSTDSSDRLSSFSSRGPGIGTEQFPLQKPDISAPGSSVYSSYPTTDTSYATLSGTSMAAPHVTGVVALLRAANPSLTVDQITQILLDSSTQAVGQPTGGQTTCAGVPYTQWPNYHYGYGRLDAYAALEAAKKL